MEFSPPKFIVLAEKQSYLLYEPLSFRFMVENPKGEKIKTYIAIIGDPIEHMGVVSTTVKGPDIKAEIYKAQSLFGEPAVGLLSPHERLTRDYLLSCKISIPGEYALNSTYTWRDSGEKHLSYTDRRINANEVKIPILEPQSVDKEALDFVGDGMLLMALQDQESLVWLEKTDEIKAMRPLFLEKFPRSTYSRNVLYAMAENQRRDGQFSAAIESFNKYVRQYPESWFVDDALYASAECLIKLKEYEEAQKTIEKLLHLQTDANIQRKAARLKEGLAKDEKTLEQIYSH
jgi:tetratricopeptide (TPR) repeat protein